jgi:hypothetical protein
MCIMCYLKQIFHTRVDSVEILKGNVPWKYTTKRRFGMLKGNKIISNKQIKLKDYSLLRCVAMQFGRRLPTLYKNTLPPSLE